MTTLLLCTLLALSPSPSPANDAHRQSIVYHAQAALAKLDAQSKALSDARNEANQQQQVLEDERAAHAALASDPWVKFILSIKRAWFWTKVTLLSLVGTVIVGRILGLVFTGPVGAIASGASHVALAILTGGLSLVTTIGDNLWFRWRKPEAAK